MTPRLRHGPPCPNCKDRRRIVRGRTLDLYCAWCGIEYSAEFAEHIADHEPWRLDTQWPDKGDR
jgi:hypothetical protein